MKIAKEESFFQKVLSLRQPAFISLSILLIYPFLQRYFVVGLNVGGVKE